MAPRSAYYFSHESTDDAYVTGTVAPISAQVKGKVVAVLIHDNQIVHARNPLFEIESDDHAATLALSEKGLLRLLNQEVMNQAMTLSFNRVFFLVAVRFVFTLPLVLLLRKGGQYRLGRAVLG